MWKQSRPTREANEINNTSRIKSADKQTVVDCIVKAVELLKDKPDLIRKSF